MRTNALEMPGTTGWLRPLRWSEPSVSGTVVPATGVAGEFALPVGTVTFLLTDVEGSTLAWQAAPGVMGQAIARHYEILDAAVAAHGGVRPQEQGEGDSIVGAFGRASDALTAAVAAQQALGAERWPDGLAGPLRVRMAIHTGEAQMRDEANYVGQAIIRTARLRAIAHGGQVLVSQAVRDLVIDQLGDRVELVDLGLHRLKDLARPEHVWQVAATGLAREFPPLKSLDAVPNNLPMELSSFVGRKSEIGAVSGLVAGNRLVTVMGSGGAGKTRLAQQVAAQLSGEFPDGTWWVELAPVDASAVRATIASVVSIQEPDRLVERLAGRMLLVLDNCEHVLDVVAPLVHQIMLKCPDVSVLATSRGALDVPGEVTWRVPPLGTPTVGEPVPIERLAQFDAVRLFVDRAVRARPNFALTTENGPAIAELCARLDGIPLAIELAAARAKSLTAEQILAGLEDALRLLTGGSRLVMPRQQTLEASIGWSHDLLVERERVLLRRLSVFAGGWDLEASEAVCANDDGLSVMEVLDCLEHLIDQSLVRVDERRGATRFQMLETVRQFASRQLAGDAAEHDRIMGRHASWFARLAAAVGPLAEGPDEEVCVVRLTPERDNLSAALRSFTASGLVVELAETTLHLGQFWNAAGFAADGRSWTTIALDSLGEQHVGLRARLLLARARHSFLTGQILPPFADAQAAVALADQVGDRLTAGQARGIAAVARGFTDLPAAAAMLETALADCRSAGDLFAEVQTLNMKTSLYVWRGELEKQRVALAEADNAAKRLANPFLSAVVKSNRASVSFFTADHDGMRSVLTDPMPGTDQSSVSEAFKAMTEVNLRADLGEEIPDPIAREARMRHLVRTENPMGASLMKSAVIRSLCVRGEHMRALDVLDDPAVGVARPQLWGVLCSMAIGDVERARAYFERGPGPQNMNVMLQTDADLVAAILARHDGDLGAAEAAIQRSLSLASTHGFARETLDALEILAGIGAAQGAWQYAARLAGAVQQRRDLHPLKARVEPLRSMLEADLGATRAALGDAAYESAFEEGRGLSVEGAVEYAQRSRGERSRPTIGWTSLTPTERRVVDLARRGRSNADIARELLMGNETVKSHLSHSYAKLGVANRTQLAALTPPSGGN